LYADLSEAIDVYSDWIDACERANTNEGEENVEEEAT
jgi:transcription elongation factor Elf1